MINHLKSRKSPLSTLMRQSAYVRSKSFWAMVCRRIKPLLRKSLYEKEKNREIHFKISSFIVAFAYEEFFEGCNVQKNNAADNQLVTYYYHEQLTYAHFHKMHSFCNFYLQIDEFLFILKHSIKSFFSIYYLAYSV